MRNPLEILPNRYNTAGMNRTSRKIFGALAAIGILGVATFYSVREIKKRDEIILRNRHEIKMLAIKLTYAEALNQSAENYQKTREGIDRERAFNDEQQRQLKELNRLRSKY